MKKQLLVGAFAVIASLGLYSCGADQPQEETESAVLETRGNENLTSSGAAIVSEYQEGIAMTKMDEKFGFVNKQGLEISRPIYQEVHLFEGGYAAAKKAGKWGFINKQGDKVVNFKYDWVANFANGVAPVSIANKWGFVNEQGDEITEIKYDKLHPFENGKALAKIGEGWVAIDEATGEEAPAEAPTAGNDSPEPTEMATETTKKESH